MRTEEIQQQKEQLQHLKNSIVHVVADIIEKRDYETGGHNDRIVEFVGILLKAMLDQGVYLEEIGDIDFDLFTSSARLHDVGKIVIPDSILNKPGRLTDEEFAIMKTHALEGKLIIEQIISRTRYKAASPDDELAPDEQYLSVSSSDNVTFLNYSRLFAGYHHERWDGKGYPYGLSGMAIPIHGRIMAFADVYDALISERPYKKAFSHEDSVRIIMENAGTQFDPFIAKVFYSVKDQFESVRRGQETPVFSVSP